MLDMAYGLTDTSRLGCQVKVTKELEGMTITLPGATRNMYVDGELPFFLLMRYTDEMLNEYTLDVGHKPTHH
jgi:hypothetical protein